MTLNAGSLKKLSLKIVYTLPLSTAGVWLSGV
jgi:hypothetical protein